MSAEDSEELPEGWAWAKLGELGAWAGGGTPTTSVASYWDDGTIPWISAKDMKADYLGASQDSITEAGREAARLTLLPSGSVLMVVRGMILARTFPVAVTTAPVTINQDLRALIPSLVVKPTFLLRALQLISPQVVQATGEATHGTRRLDSDMMKAWPIPLPPLAEQRRIVAAVERLLEKVESARERLERASKTTKQFRQAVLTAACSGRLTSDWRADNPDTRSVEEILRSLGAKPLSEESAAEEVPASWRWVRFGDVLAELKNGLSTKPNQNPPGTPILRINAVRPCEVAFDDLRYLECSDAQTRDYALRERDLLFTRYNGSLELLGVCGMVRNIDGRTIVYPDKLMRVRFSSPEILPEYCEQFFSSPAARDRMIANAKSSAGQNGVSGSDVKSQPFALPPLDEQREIVRRAFALLSLADSIDQKAKAALRRVEVLTQAVLAKAFRGELVPTEAELALKEGRSYESASELLARLKASVNGEAKRPRAKKTSKRSSGSGEGLLEFMEG